jgi:zinc transport system substrate-binding protein
LSQDNTTGGHEQCETETIGGKSIKYCFDVIVFLSYMLTNSIKRICQLQTRFIKPGMNRERQVMKSFFCTIGMLTIMLVTMILPGARADEPLHVTVSILPQKYFVEKIGGPRVAITVMVEPGAEPHVYDPKPQQMASLAKSKIYFAVGVPFEDVWLKRFAATNPGMEIVQTESGIQKLPMLAHEEHSQHREAGSQQLKPQVEGHTHGVLDPHIWLSPPLAMIQARNILSAFLKVDPARKNLYETNYRRFLEEIGALDLELLNLFEEMAGNKEFMVFHPAWGYLAAAYGLVQTPIEIEGKEPKAADLSQLIQHARERQIKVVFVQPQFSSTSAKVIAEAIGGQTIAADPMALDWANNLREVAEKFKAALK